MKRIDDKIKELEKKDKQSRILYILFVIVIVVFMVLANGYQKTIAAQEDTIESQLDTIKEKLKKEEQLVQQLKDTINLLRQSQTPVAFWNQTNSSNIASSYLDYITHKGKPETKEVYINEAYVKVLKSSVKGTSGWLFCGRYEDGVFYDEVITILRRKGSDEDYANDIPKENDIIVPKERSRKLRRSTDSNAREIEGGWSMNTKAIVTKVKKEGIAVYVKIKF